MKFVVSTKPLKNVTDLGIIKSNISKYYYRSTIVQITATRDTLILNIEASGIKTKMMLSGSGDVDEVASIIVDCSLFKKLLDSIDTEIVSLDFMQNYLKLSAGTSKFDIAAIVDANDMQLSGPSEEYNVESSSVIKSADWQFVRDHQLYAIATGEAHPVYKNVYVGTDKDLIVGDFDSSLFTYSKCGDFDTPCLFPTSIINLFTSIPDGSTISKIGRSYIINITTDNYSMVTEFTPKYEDDEAVGSYNSQIILGMLAHPEAFITIDVAPITKFINQTSILAQSDFDKVFDFKIQDNTLTMTNRVSSYSMSVESSANYTIKFHAAFFKSVLANFDSDTLNIAPMQQGERTIGCIFWSDKLTVLLAGQG